MGMVLRKILDQYVSSYQRLIKSVLRLGNNEVLKTLTKTLTFVDADADVNADADAKGSTVALRERCSGELNITESADLNILQCKQLIRKLIKSCKNKSAR